MKSNKVLKYFLLCTCVIALLLTTYNSASAKESEDVIDEQAVNNLNDEKPIEVESLSTQQLQALFSPPDTSSLTFDCFTDDDHLNEAKSLSPQQLQALFYPPDTSKLTFDSLTDDDHLNEATSLKDIPPAIPVIEPFEDIPNVSSTNWMSGIPDSRRLHEITIPGAHDAGCFNVWTKNVIGMLKPSYAITQDKHIYNQLEAGVRLLDLRWTNCYKNHISNAKYEDLYLCHGSTFLFYCLNENDNVRSFEGVMNDVHRFLRAHPTETVLLDMSSDYDDSDTEWRVYPTLTKKIKSYSWIFTENRIPTLGEVRGKAVLISSHANDLGIGLQISTPNGYGSFETNDHIHFETENHYEIGIPDKIDLITHFYISKGNIHTPLTETDKLSNSLLVETSSNCATSLGANPEKIAKFVNPILCSDHWWALRSYGRIGGWIYSDFVGAINARTNGYDMACDLIWKINFPKGYNNYHNITFTDSNGNVIHTHSILPSAQITLPQLITITDSNGNVIYELTAPSPSASTTVSSAETSADAAYWLDAETGTVYHGTIIPEGDMTLEPYEASSYGERRSSSGSCSSGANTVMLAAILFIAYNMTAKQK